MPKTYEIGRAEAEYIKELRKHMCKKIREQEFIKI